MTRGRSIDPSLPLTRSLAIQRAYRARKAQNVKHLESLIQQLSDENTSLRSQLSLYRQCPACRARSSPPLSGNLDEAGDAAGKVNGEDGYEPGLEPGPSLSSKQVSEPHLSVIDDVRAELQSALARLDGLYSIAGGQDQPCKGSSVHPVSQPNLDADRQEQQQQLRGRIQSRPAETCTASCDQPVPTQAKRNRCTPSSNATPRDSSPIASASTLPNPPGTHGHLRQSGIRSTGRYPHLTSTARDDPSLHLHAAQSLAIPIYTDHDGDLGETEMTNAAEATVGPNALPRTDQAVGGHGDGHGVNNGEPDENKCCYGVVDCGPPDNPFLQ